MITRLDHAVIGVADLDRAIDAYRRLGFIVRPGGRHTGEGTHNAIVRFGLDYLELMAVHDEALARTRPFGSQLLELLRNCEGGLIGFVVAGVDSDDLAAAMREAGLEPVGPIAMQRERPDGRVLSWRLLFPHGPRWRDIAPFVVEWVTSDADRLRWDAPVAHPNGIIRIAGLRIVVPDVVAAHAVYSQALGLAVAPLGAGLARVTIGEVAIDLVASADASPAERAGGDGLAEISLAVTDIGVVSAAIPGLKRDADGIRYRVPAASAAGAALSLVEVSRRAS